MSKNVYVVLGSCGKTHAYEVEFDMMAYWKSQGEFPVRFKEVQLRNSQNTKITKIIFDEYATDNRSEANRRAKTAPKSKLAPKREGK